MREQRAERAEEAEGAEVRALCPAGLDAPRVWMSVKAEARDEMVRSAVRADARTRGSGAMSDARTSRRVRLCSCQLGPRPRRSAKRRSGMQVVLVARAHAVLWYASDVVGESVRAI